ncbi:hypothetical protein Clacol_003603 [Clathrus columnatus]|uniref:Dihydrolipoamide acetyltransferase component of pyruvate dehydrogenase complex n=1 Tax=Clathrus columnatus TaxID=1419009 RepID=A0AAV5AA28_9AGAM|nr:hypothetical protein Clacol_003603 [Clathrus columnatus]
MSDVKLYIMFINRIVKPQSKIQSFDPLCEVQSDKANVEITSPYDGTLLKYFVEEGQMAKVGEGLCLIQVEEDTDSAEPEVSPPKEETIAQPSITSKPHPMDPRQSAVHDPKTSKDILVTPSVRHFAKQNHIKLPEVGLGSGKNGRIEKDDILTLIKQKARESANVHDASGFTEIEVGKTRLNMWKSMVKACSPVSQVLPLLNGHIPNKYGSSSQNPSRPSSDAFSNQPTESSDSTSHYTKLTFLPFLLKTLSRAMMEWPLFRASITSWPDASYSQKPVLTVRPQADISVALSTPSGLYTPTLTGVDTMNVYDIMGRLRRLQHLGRQIPCRLGPEDMPKKGGTITVSNIGAIGKGEYASPVLVQGSGLAIVAIGRAKWADVVPEDGCGPAERRLQVGISWSADHRVVEGAELAAFVESWRGWVEHPERFIGDGI